MNSIEIKKIRTVIFTLLVCYFPSLSHSQGTNQLFINFDNSTHFFLYINNQLVNQKSNSKVRNSHELRKGADSHGWRGRWVSCLDLL